MASRRNIANLLSNVWPLLVLVIGQMFVLIVGGIDLSQTSIMAVTSVIGAMFIATRFDPAKFQHNPLWNVVFSEQGGLLAGSSCAVPVAILVMLVVGIFIGFLNGIAVAKLKMPPFMVTLVAMSFFSGLAIYLTRSENIMYLPDSFITIGKGAIGPVPSALLIVVSITALAFVVLNLSVLGRWFYAVGQNIRTARVSGIPTERVVILAYVFSGFCAAIGSILYSARLEAGRPTLGTNLLLDVIGAAVIGGISLFGGKGKVLWAVYGVLFFVILDNSLNKMPLEFYSIDIIKGCVILMAALLDALRTRIAVNQIALEAGF
jgi:ribose transport system permease protein